MVRLKHKGKMHKGNNNYGFTLMETVLVMTILTIIASLSVFGLIKWQESSNFKQQNEYAQILFISAQNQLAEYENTQRIERFVSTLQDSGGNLKRVLDVTRLTDGNGDVYSSSNAVWYESAGSGSVLEASKYQGELCYASCMLGDYEQYQKGGRDALSQAARDRGADVVFALLESYVYDKNILNASISVEFSPHEGQVFAVCYRSGGGEFIYAAPSETASSGKINIANREGGYRKEQGLGYYGTDTLAKSTSDTNTKLTLADVKLNNEETLNLSFRVAKPVGISQALVYNIKVFDADEDRIVLSFDIAGSSLRSYASRRTVPVEMTGYIYGAGGSAVPVAIGTYDVLAWIEEDTTIRVVLDAADIEASTNQYLLDAAELGKEESDKKKFAKTYSFHRFGLDAENIYCTMQATGGIYRDSVEKQTQKESVYFAFAKLTKEDDKTQVFTYQLSNARHLYNVRYAEDLSVEKTASLSGKIDSSKVWQFNFLVTDTIDWNSFTESGNLYRSDAKILPLPQIFAGSDGTKAVNTVTQADFPSIRQLRYGDSFSGDKNFSSVAAAAEGQIVNIGLSMEKNLIYDIYGAEDKPVGLFLTNNGTIANLTLDGVQVTGEDYVGAFCGVNRGHLLGLTVESSSADSAVFGQTNVGGIMGYQESVNDSALIGGGEATNVALTGLINHARVSGCEYVGGIVGRIHIPADAMQPRIILSQCENYGVTEAVNSEAVAGGTNLLAKQTEPRYIGGIVGYCDNRYTNEAGGRDSSRLKVVDCISSPKYTSEDLLKYLGVNTADADDLRNILNGDYTGRNLRGVYVGGIVGYNNYASIEGCETTAENDNAGYVFGYRYVGGIAGFNQGIASGTNTAGINQANVVGCQYVGGIAGCNSDITAALDGNGVVQPDRAADYRVKIDNWLNEGIVFAADSYAGGITGYNAGWIYNCSSRVKTTGYTGFFAEAYSGDYVGGIAGYNNGIIGNTERIISADGKNSTVKPGADQTKNIATGSYVCGDSYVGGIVGYNDADSIIENYRIVGGHILANQTFGMYVGGYVGFNASARLLLGESADAVRITANPEEVTGRYFVGGIIGGNIINAKVNPDGGAAPLSELSAVFGTDSFSGEISGDAFVGGYAGYNALIEDEANNAAVILEREITERFKESDSRREDLTEKVKILDSVTAQKGMTPAGCTMKVLGTDSGSEIKEASGRITAQIYVGGVLGYNDPSTSLYIQNVKNTTRVIAAQAVRNAAEQPERTTDYAGRIMDYRYSYAGSIIGKVGTKVVIDNCRDISAGVVTAGTYTGGLCEINEGRIINCEVSAVDSAARDYIGGLCGINKPNGVIEGCKFVSKTITAGKVAGGFAAENFGRISGITVEDAGITAMGSPVAGTLQVDGVAAAVAGYNGNTGEIILDRDLGAINIVSNGRYVGGIAGYNVGQILNQKPDKETVKLSVGAGGSILGRENVGGIIGYNANKDNIAAVEYFVNAATVTGTYGNAGGIIGSNESGNIIRYCENKGAISASDAGNAGGITAENASIIEKCIDYAGVVAPKGMSGGITALNYVGAKIQDCVIQSADASERIVFAAFWKVGAVAAKNAGEITNCKVNRVLVENNSIGGESNIGIVAGENGATGTILLTADSEAVSDSIAETYSDNSKVGGVAGVNYGRISGALLNGTGLPTTVIKPVVRFKENAGKTASLGGVAGLNRGVIENISVQGTIGHDAGRKSERLLGSKTTGYGGIAGYNGYWERTEAAADAVIRNCTFDGTVWAHGLISAPANVGGIVGANGYGGSVRECAVGATLLAGETHIWGGDIAEQYAYIDSLNKTANTTDKAILRNGEYKFLSGGDNISYTYIGGIAGINYGTVISCNNNKYASENRKVRIESMSGQTGGITGITYEGGIVTGTKEKPLSTGTSWTVEAYAASENAGTGGIVGTYYSGQNLEYVNNYAAVKNRYYANACVGGLIGAVLQNEDSGITVSDCNNYGYILSASRVSGMVCLDMFRGITFRNCNNYGEQRAQAGSDASLAGFLAYAKSVDTDIHFYKCNDYANLTRSNTEMYTGGFVAFKNGAGTIYMQDCVNVGLIREFEDAGYETTATQLSVAEAAGFIHCSDGISYVDNCRNYSNQGAAPAIAGSGKVVLTNCLDTSGTAYVQGLFPFAGNADTGSRMNYYIGRQNIGAEGLPSVKEPEKSEDADEELVIIDAAPKRELIVVNEGTDGSYELVPADIWIPEDTKIRMSGSTRLRGGEALNGYYADDSVYDVKYDLTQTGWSANTRASLYKELDEKYRTFLLTCNYKTATRLKAPTGLSTTQSKGFYVFNWKQSEDAFNYQVYYTLSDEEGVVRYSGENEPLEVADSVHQAKFSAEELDEKWREAEGRGDYVATFYVRAVSAYHKLHENDADADIYDSDYISKDQKELIVLPKPEFHIEAIENCRFVVMLDNIDAYAKYAGGCKIMGSLNSISYTIDMSTGRSNPLAVNLSGAKDYNFSATAVATDISKYMSSATTKYSGSLMGSEEYPATGADEDTRYQISIDFDGFCGVTEDALSYRITFGAKNRDMYMSAEILAEDEALGVAVAYADGIVHTSNRADADNYVYTSVSLAGFAKNTAGKDIEVRAYPYASQNEICYYGHIVADSVKLTSYEDVKLISDENYINEEGQKTVRTILDENGSLRPGYVIRNNPDEDGTYNIYWSASLAMYESEERPFQVADIIYKLVRDEETGIPVMNDSGYNYYAAASVPSAQRAELLMQPAPVIEKSGYPIIKEEEGHTTYTFEWDKSAGSYDGAAYSLELFGCTEGGGIISIETVSGVTQRMYTFTGEPDIGSYKELILWVSRDGAADSSDRTTILPQASKEKFTLKRRMTAIATPKVMPVTGNETPDSGKNNLCYEVTWDAITAKEELEDLGGYLITAYALITDDLGADIIERKVCFYAAELTSLKDWQDAYADGIYVENEDILTGREISAEDYITSGEGRQAIIDLSAFEAADYVYIRVQAIARPDSDAFVNGGSGAPAEVEIIKHLATFGNATYGNAAAYTSTYGDALIEVATFGNAGYQKSGRDKYY